jgi:hypothetical protein
MMYRKPSLSVVQCDEVSYGGRFKKDGFVSLLIGSFEPATRRVLFGNESVPKFSMGALQNLLAGNRIERSSGNSNDLQI